MKPVIGLVPLYDEKLNSYWMLPEYMQAIEEAGGLAVMLPLTNQKDVLEQLAQKIDGLLLTGGHDIEPSFYQQARLEQCQVTCPLRDEMEKILLDIFYQADRPVLGICRGLQFLNVYLGGTLYQDLPTQINSPLKHSMQPPFDAVAHEVDLVSDTPLADLLQVKILGVNSRHHQAIDQLAPDLKAMAYSKDGLVEAIYAPDKRYIFALQWHPEHMKASLSSQLIFKQFIQQAKSNN